WSAADTAISVADLPLRFLIFLGLVGTFSKYFAAKETQPDVPVPNLKRVKRELVGGKITAWLVLLFNAGAFAGSVGAVYWMTTHSFSNPDKDRPIWVQLFTDGPPLLGSVHALLLILYLVTMNSLRALCSIANAVGGR